MSTFSHRLNLLLNPHDMTPLNGLGSLCLDQCWYTAFRAIMAILTLGNFCYIANYLAAKYALSYQGRCWSSPCGAS